MYLCGVPLEMSLSQSGWCEASQWELCTEPNTPSYCCVQREAAACSGADTLHCFIIDIYRCGLLDLRGPNTDFSPKRIKIKTLEMFIQIRIGSIWSGGKGDFLGGQWFGNDALE